MKFQEFGNKLREICFTNGWRFELYYNEIWAIWEVSVFNKETNGCLGIIGSIELEAILLEIDSFTHPCYPG